ncbi:MAG: aminotransferase class V-fold PLP-dependent enzyme [Treponema sp.]|jgi:threonine aldolase|nr:aminotransferase class V-fold PLP-dependent enzyme [Treponema sp.]
MYSFKDDYSELGHERVLTNLLKISNKQLDGYGMDIISAQAKELIKNIFCMPNADIHFLSGGTQTNLVFINSVLSSIEAVIAADSSHICVSECGAIEHNGHKILTALNKSGKLLPSDIEAICAEHINEHRVKPKLVFVSQSTELGTVYTKKELENLFETCKKHCFYFYIDGARIGTALVTDNDVKPEDFSALCDAFYIGGTKNGSPLGEALCIINQNLKNDFRYYLKQHGAMLAKGSLTGSCFKTLFEDNLYFDLARYANKMSQKLAKAFTNNGYKMFTNSPTNQIFPILPNKKIEELQKFYKFHVWEKIDDNNSVIRLVCSWATDENEVDRLIAVL